MLRNCGCFQRKRRSPSIEDSSSCRSSEIERGGETTPRGSLGKLFSSRGWCRGWRKGNRGMSMTKIERSKFWFSDFFYWTEFNLVSPLCWLRWSTPFTTHRHKVIYRGNWIWIDVGKGSARVFFTENEVPDHVHSVKSICQALFPINFRLCYLFKAEKTAKCDRRG